VRFDKPKDACLLDLDHALRAHVISEPLTYTRFVTLYEAKGAMW